MSNRILRFSIRTLLIQGAIYAVLMVAYFLLVLRFLGDWLLGIFNNSLVVYGGLTLVMIITQGVVLDLLTSFIVDRIRLD